MSQWHRQPSLHATPFRNLLKIGLMPADRPALHARIAHRFATMLDLGLVEEVRQLRCDYHLAPTLPSMRSVGYRQVWEYLEGEVSIAQMTAKAVAATRQLAKRQLTWMRSMADLELFEPESADLGGALVRRVAAFLEA